MSKRDRQLPRRSFVSGSVLAAGGAALASAASRANDDRMKHQGCITDVGGIRVGHFTDSRKPTGCTVVIFEKGAVGGVDVRGSAPGTRETDLLNPINTVERVNAFLLSGGSAFGLDAATGVMRYLEQHGEGYAVGPLVVPIVPAAILFDLNVGDPKIRPDAESGFAACEAATSSSVHEGNVGAGAGATVGKLFGARNAMKSGLGSASIRVGDTGLVVGAIVAVNAVGDVLDADTGKILAGARTPDGKHFRDTMAQILSGATIRDRSARAQSGANTTLGIIATNASLTKSQVNKVAQMAHDGLARTIRPVHTAADGDTIFAAATGSISLRADVTTVGSIAAEAIARAVNRAVLAATGIPGYPAHRDLANA